LHGLYLRICTERLQHHARQVGKNTLSRLAFPVCAFLDMEGPGTYNLFAEDARFQLDARGASSLILDEAHSVYRHCLTRSGARLMPNANARDAKSFLRRATLSRPHIQAYFWRTAGGAETDLMLENGHQLHAIEI
jgi:hypothetical protein